MFNEQMIQSSAIAEIAITYIKSKKFQRRRDAMLFFVSATNQWERKILKKIHRYIIESDIL